MSLPYRCRAAALLGLAVLTSPSAAAADGGQLYARASAAVGVVATDGSTGTGFVVGPRLMLTAEHVVQGVDEVSVQVDGRRLAATVQRRDPTLDVALLALADDVRTVLDLREEPPHTGEEVYALGAARGDLSITRGVVSRVRTDEQPPHLQTDAAINPGNSGGPLLGAGGDVVGLVVSKLRDAEGIALAVPAAQLEAFLAGSGQAEPAPAAPAPAPASALPPGQLPADGPDARWALVLPVLGAAYLLRSRPRDPVVVLGPLLAAPLDGSTVAPAAFPTAPPHATRSSQA